MIKLTQSIIFSTIVEKPVFIQNNFLNTNSLSQVSRNQVVVTKHHVQITDTQTTPQLKPMVFLISLQLNLISTTSPKTVQKKPLQKCQILSNEIPIQKT